MIILSTRQLRCRPDVTVRPDVLLRSDMNGLYPLTTCSCPVQRAQPDKGLQPETRWLYISVVPIRAALRQAVEELGRLQAGLYQVT